MRKAVALAGVLAFGGGFWARAGEPAKTTLSVQGMTCGGCVAAVKVQLKRTEGVTAYEVSLAKAEAEVTYDPARTTPDKIAESVSKTGFEASVKKPGTKHGASCERDCGKAPKRVTARSGDSAVPLVSLAQDAAPLALPSRWVRQTTRFGSEKSGSLISLMWRNDYASPPFEGSLTEELRKLLPGASAARIGAVR